MQPTSLQMRAVACIAYLVYIAVASTPDTTYAFVAAAAAMLALVRACQPIACYAAAAAAGVMLLTGASSRQLTAMCAGCMLVRTFLEI